MKIVQAFITDELGTLRMDMSKQELLDIAQSKNYKFEETARTVALKDQAYNTMMYVIFTDALDRILLVDLCCTELVEVVIDGKNYSPEYIREHLKWKHTMECSYRGEKVLLDKNMNAACSTGLKCRMCQSAGYITHEAFLEESIITYIDFGESTDNEMFCFENNHGKPVDFEKIEKEDAKPEPIVKRETEYFDGGCIERFYDFKKINLVGSYDYDYGQEENFKDVPEFLEYLWNVDLQVRELFIDYFTYLAYKEKTSAPQIVQISFDSNHMRMEKFQKNIIQNVIEMYPEDLIITKFYVKDTGFFAAEGATNEERFHFLVSQMFADPRLRGENEDEFMMVYAGNRTGYEYLKTLGVALGYEEGVFLEEMFEDDEYDEAREAMDALSELASYGAFTDEGIFPEDYDCDYDYDYYDPFEEFKVRVPKRFSEKKSYGSNIPNGFDGEECPF